MSKLAVRLHNLPKVSFRVDSGLFYLDGRLEQMCGLYINNIGDKHDDKH